MITSVYIYASVFCAYMCVTRTMRLKHGVETKEKLCRLSIIWHADADRGSRFG